MNNSELSTPTFVIEQDIMDIDFINDFHSTLILPTITAPSIVKLLIDNTFANLTLDNIGYSFTDESYGKVLLRDIIREHKDALVQESSTVLTFHRVGSYYVVQGSEKVIQIFAGNGIFSEVETGTIDFSLETLPAPEFTTSLINDLVENTLNLIIEEHDLVALGKSEYPALSLYLNILSDIAFQQDYFAYKSIDGLRESISNSSVEASDEQINLAVDSTKNEWTELFFHPIRKIYEEEVAVEESFIHGTMEEFIKFFPEIVIMDEPYVNVLKELGLYEEF